MSTGRVGTLNDSKYTFWHATYVIWNIQTVLVYTFHSQQVNRSNNLSQNISPENSHQFTLAYF